MRFVFLISIMLGLVVSVPVQAQICTNTCRFANNGKCDDGGPESSNSLCEYGSDCQDCGSRCVLAGNTCESSSACCSNICLTLQSAEPVSLCSDSCASNSDCSSGCCAVLTNGERACAPPQYCERTCTDTGQSCTRNDACCSELCLRVDDTSGVCADKCLYNSECESSCCVEISSGGGACVDASSCNSSSGSGNNNSGSNQNIDPAQRDVVTRSCRCLNTNSTNLGLLLVGLLGLMYCRREESPPFRAGATQKVS